MTEHDRGAYMPQSDAPLAFDARAPRDSRPMPMTLIASGGVLVLILGALFLAYRGGVHGAAEAGAVRTVGQPVAAIKVAPAPGAQPQDPDAGLDVYAAQNVPAEAEKPAFTPPPEQPQARPAPRQAAAAPTGLQITSLATPPVRIEAPEAVAPAASPRTTIKPGAADQKGAAAALAPAQSQIAAAPTVKAAPAKAASVETPTAKPAPAKPVAIQAATPPSKPAEAVAKPAAAAEVAAALTTSGAAAVQIGAFSSRELAGKGYADVSAAMSGRMGGHGSHVEPVAKDGKTMFRTTVTGFSDRAAAKTFCAALSAKGHSCFVKAG